MPSNRYYRYKIFDQDKKIRRRKKFFISGLILIFLTALLWTIYLSAIFEIKEIKVSQTDKIKAQDIRQVISDLPLYSKFKLLYNWLPRLQKNLVIISKTELAYNLTAAFPEIRDLKIEKNFFHTLSIKFNIRQQIGIWCDVKNHCYYIDSDGIIFSDAPESQGALILKIQDLKNSDSSLGQNVIDFNLIKFLVDFRTGLTDSKKIIITLYKVNSDKNIIEAQTSENWLIFMEPTDNPGNLLKILTSTLDGVIKNKRQNLEYIDLRIPDRIFYKLK